ncbi:MAG: hypothetical protein ACPHK2_05045 [Candidatus Poseidoniaceae archaeon]
MSDDMEELVDQRLSVFDDEPDLNDWVEIMCGAAMAVLGIFHLVNPGTLVDPDIMRWFASAVVAAGAVWAGHGLKDMAVKEVRRSIALMDIANQTDDINHGLIRDVLLNPEAYAEFLINAYDSAWEDGVITDEEYEELKSFQKALGISDEDAAKMNLEAAVKSAAKDGEISEDEKEMIRKAAADASQDADSIIEEAKKKAKEN